MILDKNLELSAAQAITNASAASTNIIDQLAAGDGYNTGRIHILVNTTFTGGTGLYVELQTATDAAFTSAITLVKTGEYLEAALLAGVVLLDANIPRLALRYLRAYYTTDGTHTAGKVDARIVLDSTKTLDKLV